MLNKQFGSLHLLILAAILGAAILLGLGVIVYLDHALIARTVSQRESQQDTPVNTQQDAPTQFVVEITQEKPTLGAANNPGATIPGTPSIQAPNNPLTETSNENTK